MTIKQMWWKYRGASLQSWKERMLLAAPAWSVFSWNTAGTSDLGLVFWIINLLVICYGMKRMDWMCYLKKKNTQLVYHHHTLETPIFHPKQIRKTNRATWDSSFTAEKIWSEDKINKTDVILFSVFKSFSLLSPAPRGAAWQIWLLPKSKKSPEENCIISHSLQPPTRNKN